MIPFERWMESFSGSSICGRRSPVFRFPLSGSGYTWLCLQSGVLRIVLRTPVGGVSQPSESSDSVPYHQLDLLHRRLVLRLEVAIESHVLVDRQGLTAGMTGDQLKLGVSQATDAGSAR